MRQSLVLVPLLVGCNDVPSATSRQMPILIDPQEATARFDWSTEALDPQIVTARLDWSTVPKDLDTGELQQAFTAALSYYGMHEGDGGVLIRWSDIGKFALGGARGATIELSTHYRWTMGGCQPYAYDVESVLLHELGHTQGLVHTEDGIMAPAIAQCDVRRLCVP